MNTKTRSLATSSKKFETHKETYRAKLETIRRKQIRNHKQSFDQARSTK